jgi:ankyrin repeat protein
VPCAVVLCLPVGTTSFLFSYHLSPTPHPSTHPFTLSHPPFFYPLFFYPPTYQDIDVSNNFGQSPLIIAAHHGHANIVTFLVDRGANIDHQNNDGLSALDLARDEDMEELLITLKRIVCADPEDRW